MKKIDYYKLQNIISIHIQDKSKAYGYFYRADYKQKNPWSWESTHKYDGFITNEGDMYDDDWQWYNQKDVEGIKDDGDQRLFLVLSNVVYNRPKAIVVFLNKTGYTHRFDTIEEATEWAEDLLKKANLGDEVLRIN